MYYEALGLEFEAGRWDVENPVVLDRTWREVVREEAPEKVWVHIEFEGEYSDAEEQAIERACGEASYEGCGSWNKISGWLKPWEYDELRGELKRLGIEYVEYDEE